MAIVLSRLFLHRTPLVLGHRYIRAYTTIGRCSSCILPAPHAFKERSERRHRSHLSSICLPFNFMIPETLSRRHIPPFPSFSALSPSSSTMVKASFDDSDFLPPLNDSDIMIFGPLDMDDSSSYDQQTPFPLSSFDAYNDFNYPRSLSSLSDQHCSHPIVDFVPNIDHNLSSYPIHNDLPSASPEHDEPTFYFSYWVNDKDLTPIPPTSSPIPIPSSICDSTESLSFTSYTDYPAIPSQSLSPPDLAALVPLPRSFSPGTVAEESHQCLHLDSVSPQETSVHPPPEWAMQLWDDQSFHPPTTSSGPNRHTGRSESSHALRRHRYPTRRDSSVLGQTLYSSSAPSLIQMETPTLTRTYRHRAESIGEDNDATIRRKKRVSAQEETRTSEKAEGRMWSFKSRYQSPPNPVSDSSYQITFASSQISSFCLATLLHRLDIQTANF